MPVPSISRQIAQALQIDEKQVRRTLTLLSEGATVPFISRYRKEATGGLDEVQIEAVQTRHEQLLTLEKRRNSILESIEKQGLLNVDLKNRINSCQEASELEDLYLPFRPKRRTRAGIAREKGLEPLALSLLKQLPESPRARARNFLSAEVESTEAALQGACDILAERFSEDVRARTLLRSFYKRSAVIVSKVVRGQEAAGEKYRAYFDWSEPLARCSSHRFLAMKRGEKEGFLKVTLRPADESESLRKLKRLFVRNETEAARYVTTALEEGYKRLLRPSIETEIEQMAREEADRSAIAVFAENAKQLLLEPPLGPKRVLAIDPGFRTGCKVACIDEQGALLHHEAIYPHPPRQEEHAAARRLELLVSRYAIEAIAVGNGTAGRETERFVRELRFDRDVAVFSVSENGASIYSASPAAREEFPDLDVTVRGAVSIGRRLIDPLAELVKIEPKSIGVGQYQHDVDQPALKKALDATVLHCVNRVGVNLNTASKHLLTYVSGLGPALADNIVTYRQLHGSFRERKELLKVPRLGAKAFEQAAGFLRIPDGTDPLDNSAVHPESYGAVSAMARDLHCRPQDLIGRNDLRACLQLERYVDAERGLPTLLDMLDELEKPGRDPRGPLATTDFDPAITKITDLRPGMELNGIVTNLTRFGCFVDIGVKENGLVHISEMADRYISDPSQVVSLHQPVRVRILEVDPERKRIGLSLRIVPS